MTFENFKNPNGNAKAALKDPKELLEEIKEDEQKIMGILLQIKTML